MDVQALIAHMRKDLASRRSQDRLRVDELAQRQTFVGTSKGRALSASPAIRPSRSRLVPPVSVVRGATIVHHVTLLSTFNQSIASGGGQLQWEWFSEASPNQRRGFTTLAANQVPTFQVPVDITGVLNFRLTGSWGEEQDGGATVAKGLYWREAGAITVRLIRNGSTIGERTYPAGRVVSATYEVIDDGWEVIAGDVLEVELPNSSGEAQRHRQAELTYKIIELAQKTSTAFSPTATLHGYDEPASRPTQVTIEGNSDISAGDLLVAFVASNEPDVTMPSGWTNEAIAASGDPEYRLDWRVAQSGDDSASWTWEATGGTSSDLSLAVTVIVIRSADTSDPFDGTPGSEINAVGTATSLNPTMTSSSSSSLLFLAAATVNNDTNHSVSGMTQEDHYNDASGEVVSTIWSKPAAGGAESETVTWTGGAGAGAFLFAIRIQ